MHKLIGDIFDMPTKYLQQHWYGITCAMCLVCIFSLIPQAHNQLQSDKLQPL